MKLLEIMLSGQFFKKRQFSEKVIIIVLLLSQIIVFGQKNKINQNLVWYGYYSNLIINEKYSLKSEIQERHFIKPIKQHQLVFRTNLERKLGGNWSGTAGFTFFLQSPNDPSSESNLMVPELRPDVGFQNSQKLSFFTISHRYKAEARFFNVVEDNQLTNKYVFSNFRFRYQLGFEVPLLKKDEKEELILKVKDEILLNVGSKIVKNTFDQNRIYLAVNYAFTPFLALELGYMNWFQQQTSGVDFYNRNIIRFSIFQKINLRKNKHE